MYVRVDDGDGIFLSIGSCEGGGDPDRPRGSRLDEFASIHFSFPLVLHLERHWDPNPGCDYTISFQIEYEGASWTKHHICSPSRYWPEQPFHPTIKACKMISLSPGHWFSKCRSAIILQAFIVGWK